MKKLVILGAGTAGTIVANRMRRKLPRDWSLAVVDPEPVHLYQPGLLFLPFGARDEAALQRPRGRTLRAGIDWIRDRVAEVDLDRKTVRLAAGETLPYDLLVIASGVRLRFDLTPGLVEARTSGVASDFYSFDGAVRLRERLAAFEKGRLVLNVVEMPIKCPVAPLEFLFLADDYFRRRGVRDRVELVYATPLDGAFTRPLAASLLGRMLSAKGVKLEADFGAAEVDPARRVLRSYDEREVPFDLLVSIPTHSGAEFVERSGLGNELAFVSTERQTLEVKGRPGVFALGDATDLPSSKAGSVAHFQAEVLEANLLRAVRGQSPAPEFDGHANCFVETGAGKALLIDFNYDVEPVPGRFPGPAGPFSLMRESRTNHAGKLAFRWLYWNGLLPGKPIPISTRLSLSGKRIPALQPQQAQ